MHRFIYLYIAVSFILSSNTYAYTTSDFPCLSGTELDMQACLDLKYKEADKNLNKVYKEVVELVKIIDKSKATYAKVKSDYTLSQLVKEERKWIELRDASCETVSRMLGPIGSMSSTYYARCMLKTTLERVKYLQDLKLLAEDIAH
ncbi:MAG TPA: lysozyme inhibitor LprI family protein [Gammaproteobacteria bacterium]